MVNLNRVFYISILFYLAILTSQLYSSPVRSKSTCGPAKCKSGKKFHYREGGIYGYEYSINATSSIDGGPDESSSFQINAKIGLKFISACDGILQIKEMKVSEVQSDENSVTVNEINDSKEFTKSTKDHFLRFSYHDGLIEEICPSPKESKGSLNFKRGILSALQNTMKRLDLDHKSSEEDVHGNCRVEYKLGEATSSSLTIEKFKDLDSCGDTFGVFSSVQGTPYNFGKKLQSMPAVSSTIDCYQVVDRNLLSQVRCKETHKLRSLSRGTAGAYMRIAQSLNLLSVYTHKPQISKNETEEEFGETEKEEEEEGLKTVTFDLDTDFKDLLNKEGENVEKRAHLQFEHHYSTGAKGASLETAKLALKDFCDSFDGDVSVKNGDLFDTLLETLRGLNIENMKALNGEASQLCNGKTSHFHDVLEGVGTSSSLLLMKDLILSSSVPPPTIRSWLNSLSFIPSPPLSLIQSSVELLRIRDSYPSILLSFSSLSHAYCRNNEHCERSSGVNILIRLFVKYFSATGCGTKSGKDVETVLMYLKGIGNFGYAFPGYQDILAKCVMKNDNNEVRVAAIEATRRMKCNRDTSLVMKIFKDVDEDSEVRIAAFISLMRCPDYYMIQNLRNVLENEEVNQVGSFVWSFLTNIQETALPSKIELQALLADEKLRQKYISDFKKWSRNFELSSFYNDINFGVGVDSNLIFSQKSYIPRSAMLNLTVDLFGESVNIFEANLRLENLEQYFESYFGPNGKLNLSPFKNFFSSSREKRALPSKRRLKQITNEFGAMQKYYSDSIGSFSIKIFGNEILFERGDVRKFLESSSSPLYFYKELFTKKLNAEKSRSLIDSSYIIPTGIGIPLNLTAKATGIYKINLENSFENSEKGVILKETFMPSALLSLTGSMVLGTPDFKIGVKLKTSLRSSVAVEAKFYTEGTKLIEASFGLPQTELDILDYKSELIFIKNQNEVQISSKIREGAPVCKRSVLGTFLGLKPCLSYYFHLSSNSVVDTEEGPYYPLNGPARFRINLEKNSPELLRTKLVWENDVNDNFIKIRATTELEGSRENLIYGLDFSMDYLSKKMKASLVLPKNELKLTGGLDNDEGFLNITARADQQTYFELESYYKEENSELRPRVKLSSNGEILVAAAGNIQITDLNVEKTERAYRGDGTFQFFSKEGNFETTAYKNSLNRTLNFLISGNYERENFKFGLGIKKYKTELVELSLKTQSSVYPSYDLDLISKHQSLEDKFLSESEIRVGNGPTWSERSFKKISHKILIEKDWGNSSSNFIFSYSDPSTQKLWKVESFWNRVKKGVDAYLDITYAPERSVKTSLKFNTQTGVGLNQELEWTLTFPQLSPLNISFKLNENAHRSYKGVFYADYFGNGAVKIEGDYNDTSIVKKIDKVGKIRMITYSSNSMEVLTLGFNIFSDDKDSKIMISTGADSGELFTIELGHRNLSRGKILTKHLIYSSLKNNGKTYLISLEGEKSENDFQLSLSTQMNEKYRDILLRLKGSSLNKIHNLSLKYEWDSSIDSSQNFYFSALLDFKRKNLAKIESTVSYPGRQIFYSTEYRQDNDMKGLKGRLSWDISGNIQFSAQLRKSEIETDVVYDFIFDANTPFTAIMSPNANVRVQCNDEVECVLTFDSGWGRREKIKGMIQSSYIVIDPVDKSQNYESNLREDEVDENETEERRRKRRDSKRGGVIFKLSSNVTSTLIGYEEIRLSFQHEDHGLMDMKTDFDLQLMDSGEVSLSTQWILPTSLANLWSSRFHFQLKTPFDNFTTLDIQALLHSDTDSDTLGTFGLYSDNSQYSLTLTGTRKWEDSGSLGFDLISSHPALEKLFGSLSFSLISPITFALQLGWPRGIIGIEIGVEWSGTGPQFEIYLKAHSPWTPLRSLTTLAKIENSLAEFKALLNDEGIAGKSEWVIESLHNFDIRFDGSSPFDSYKRVGFIGKHNFEEDETYYSQFSIWINEKNIGYKLEGSKSEVEEEDGAANMLNSQLELDLLFYPTLRSTFSLAQRISKFNIASSLLLREGPINVSMDLELLDLFRFNEIIKVSTPFPDLFEIEVNLNPAIIPESSLYNLNLGTRWRSYSEWNEAGLYLRIGNQKHYSEALSSDIAENLDYEAEGDEEEKKPPKSVQVPMTQLIHFHSPISFLKVFKLEFEREFEDGENNEENGDVNEEKFLKFTVFNFIFSSEMKNLNLEILNEEKVQSLKSGLSISDISFPISYSFVTELDRRSAEKKFSFLLTSLHPKLDKIELEALFASDTSYVSWRIDIGTSFENWESQSLATKYEHMTSGENLESWELEAESVQWGKFETSVLKGPHKLNLVFKSPYQGYSNFEILTGATTRKQREKILYNTRVTINLEDVEVLSLETKSNLKNNDIETNIRGEVNTEKEYFRKGVISGSFLSSNALKNGDIEIDFGEKKISSNFRVELNGDGDSFQKVILKVDIPIDDHKNWEVSLTNNANIEEKEFYAFYHNVAFDILTPYEKQGPIRGNFIFKEKENIYEIEEISLIATSPSGNLNFLSSSNFQTLHSFDFLIDADYNFKEFFILSNVPLRDILKFKLRNFNVVQPLKIDSNFHYETPSNRLGASILVSHEINNLSVRMSRKYLNESTNFESSTEYDEEWSFVDGNIGLSYGDNVQNSIKSNYKINLGAESFDGVINLETVPQFLAISSDVNCSYGKNSPFEINGGVKSAASMDNIDEEENSKLRFNLLYKSLEGFEGSIVTNLDEEIIPIQEIKIKHFKNGNAYDGNFGGEIFKERGSFSYDFNFQNLAPSNWKINGTFGLLSPFPKSTEGNIDINFRESISRRDGDLKLIVNKNKMIETDYYSESLVLNDWENSILKIDIWNRFWPFGLSSKSKTNEKSYKRLNRNKLTKQLYEIYDLMFPKLHKWGTEIEVLHEENGKTVTLLGTHPMRKIELKTRYENYENEFNQTLQFNWGTSSSISYDLNLKEETNGEQKMSLKIKYPVREIIFNGVLLSSLPTGYLNTDYNLNATSASTLSNKINWSFTTTRNGNTKIGNLSSVFSHVLLKNDFKTAGSYEFEKNKKLGSRFFIDYANNLNNNFDVSLDNLFKFELPFWNFNGNLIVKHQETGLEFNGAHISKLSPADFLITSSYDWNDRMNGKKYSELKLEMFEKFKKLLLKMEIPESKFFVKGEYELANYVGERSPLHIIYFDTNYTHLLNNSQNQFTQTFVKLDAQKPFITFESLNDVESRDGFFGRGGYVDPRNIYFELFESYDDYKFTDFNFNVRLNHSRLLSSSIKWRPELYSELSDYLDKKVGNLKEDLRQKFEDYRNSFIKNSAEGARNIWEDSLIYIGPLLDELRSLSDFGKDVKALKEFFHDATENNDFYSQDLIGLAQVFADQVSIRFSNIFIKLREYREDMLGDSSTTEIFEKYFIYALETLKKDLKIISKVFEELNKSLKELKNKILVHFENLVEEGRILLSQLIDGSISVAENFFDYFGQIFSKVKNLVWSKTVSYKTRIFNFVHLIEKAVYETILKITDFFYATSMDLLNTSYFKRVSKLSEDFDKIAQDFKTNDIFYNLSKYSSLLFNFMAEKLGFDSNASQKMNFGKIGELLTQLITKIQESELYMEIQEDLKNIKSIMEWLSEYTGFKKSARELVLDLMVKGPELMSETIIENSGKWEVAKTKFIFDTDKGIIHLEQKLPMPWSSFETKPIFSELPEYSTIYRAKRFVDSTFLPPPYQNEISNTFDSHSFLISPSFLYSFNGKGFQTQFSSCTLLLAADLVDGNFTISLESGKNGKNNIIVSSAHNSLIIDMENKILIDPKRPENNGLPIQMIHLQGFFIGDDLMVKGAKGDFSVICNVVNKICRIRISGWYSRKVGGLLGRMDGESITDSLSSKGGKNLSFEKTVTSWIITDNKEKNESLAKCEIVKFTPLQASTIIFNQTETSICEEMFKSSLSALKPCFSKVDPGPFYHMCTIESGKECTIAQAYILHCANFNIEIETPIPCIKCKLNRQKVGYGEVKKIEGDLESSSTDVILIVENKDCNRNLNMRRRVKEFIMILEEELQKANFVQNRYGVVGFGGDGIFSTPQPVSLRGQFFTSAEQIDSLLKIVHGGGNNGSKNVLEAIKFSLTLSSSRPTSPKTLILFPCSNCDSDEIDADISSIQYEMEEKEATLHIITHRDLHFEEKRIGKKIFGMDERAIYTKSDGESLGPLRGNFNLRKEVSRKTFGSCGYLAMETNGTIFNGKKLESKKNEIFKLFSKLFARRALMSLSSSKSCFSCFCDQNNVLDCSSCNYGKNKFYFPQRPLEAQNSENIETTEMSEIEATNSNKEKDEDYYYTEIIEEES